MPTVILEDNKLTIALAKYLQFYRPAKHINIRYHFYQRTIAHGTNNLKYCLTTEMIADNFTRGINFKSYNKPGETTSILKLHTLNYVRRNNTIVHVSCVFGLKGILN